MDTLITVLVVGLATYRIARMLVLEDGPGDVFLRVRAWAGCYDYGQDGRAQTNLGRALNCMHCTGVYVGVLAFLGHLILPSAVVFLAALGLASLATEMTR